MLITGNLLLLLMSYEIEADLPMSSLPWHAFCELNRWHKVKYDLETVEVRTEKKPWNPSAKVVYVNMMDTDGRWFETEIPFWLVAVWKTAAEDGSDRKGISIVEYRRIEKDDGKNGGQFKVGE